jgi:uncharacterized protein (TIGR00297 family)
MDSLLIATIIISVLIILYAYLRKKINLSAVISAGIIGTIVLLSVGVYWLYLVLVFFIAGNLITKYGYEDKHMRGVAEGVRTYKNVFGNGGSAMVFSIFYAVTNNPMFIFGFMGAMAEAAADTFATEVGQVYEKRPRLITTLKRVKVGTSGAVSFHGEIAAMAGAGIISLIPMFFPFDFHLKSMAIPIGIIAGFIGCNIDSLLGATIERNRMDKHMINFFGTLSGGISAMLLYMIL